MSVDVTSEDQGRINRFSQLNIRRHELVAEGRHLKKSKEDIEEASGASMNLHKPWSPSLPCPRAPRPSHNLATTNDRCSWCAQMS